MALPPTSPRAVAVTALLALVWAAAGATGPKGLAETQTATKGRTEGPETRPARLVPGREAPLIEPKTHRDRSEATDLPAPGSMISDRRCRLSYNEEAGRFVLSFPDHPSKPALHDRFVLRCGWLESMEAELDRHPNVTFRVSGETTIYRKQAFLLPTKVIAERPRRAGASSVSGDEGSGAESGADDAPASRPTTRPSGEAPQGAPETRPAGGEAGTSSDRILEELLEERWTRPLLPPETDAEAQAPPERPVAPLALESPAEPGRDVVVHRMAYIVPEEGVDWWQARFVSDNNLGAEPLRLLPCGLLQRAENLFRSARARGRALRCRVSGKITRYRGRRYLLLRKLLPKRRMGMF